MYFWNSKFAQVGLVAASLLLTHCSGDGTGPSGDARTAAVARMQPLVKTVASYSDTLSSVGAGQNTTAAMQAAGKLASVVAPGIRVPIEPVLKAVKTTRNALHLPGSTVQDYLNSAVFVPANVESINGDTTTYLLHGSSLCGNANAVPDPNVAIDSNTVVDPNDSVSSACEQNIDKLAIRCVVTTNGQNQNIAVRVGNATDDVLMVTYSASSQAITVDGDLAQLEGVLATLGTTSQAQATGHVSVTMAQPGAKQMSATWGFSTAVTVTSAGTAATSAQSVSFAISPQAFSVSTNDTTWQIAVAMGAVDFTGPLTGSDGKSTTTLKAHLAGLTGQVMGDSSSQGSITVRGIGLGDGPSTLTQDDDVLLQAEINADANHTFDLTIGASDANGTQTLTVSPKLDATVKVAMAPLSLQYSVPQELLSNTYGLAITHAGMPVELNLFEGDLLGVVAGNLQVVQGQMVLTSTQGNVTVPAGQCLSSNPRSPRGPSWVTQQQAVACSADQD